MPKKQLNYDHKQKDKEAHFCLNSGAGKQDHGLVSSCILEGLCDPGGSTEILQVSKSIVWSWIGKSSKHH